MSDEPHLLQTITQNPDDDGPRLVYADWLEEHGDTDRAEFIRLQCRTAQVPFWHPQRAELLRREFELWDRYQQNWLDPLRSLLLGDPVPPSFGGRLYNFVFRPQPPPPWYEDMWPQFHRGFLEGLSLSPWTFLAFGDELFRVAPLLREVSFSDGPPPFPRARRILDQAGISFVQGGWAPLFSSPLLKRLRSLGLLPDEPEAAFAQMLGCPHLDNLRELSLSFPLECDSVRQLTGSPLLSRLTGLDLFTSSYLGQSTWTEGTLGPEAARVLADSSACRNLKNLGLFRNRLGDEGVAALAQSPHLANLATLSLGQNHLSDVGAQSLIDSPYLQRLERLDLIDNGFTEQGRQQLRARFGPRVTL